MFDGTQAFLNNGFSKHSTEQAQITIEHEMMHNISRWCKMEPSKISLLKNVKLRINGRMTEAGDYYQHCVYRLNIKDPSSAALSACRSPHDNFVNTEAVQNLEGSR